MGEESSSKMGPLPKFTSLRKSASHTYSARSSLSIIAAKLRKSSSLTNIAIFSARIGTVEALSPGKWIKDGDRKFCAHKECSSEFTTINRRHHCRHCGDIFCPACTTKKVKLKFPDGEKSAKVCPTCFTNINIIQSE